MIIIEFEDKNLEILYENGKIDNKKYRFQPSVIKQFIKTINKLRAAPDLNFLFKLQSLNYEFLKDDLKGFESVRINDKYRIVFKSRTENNETIVYICRIYELSNHYQ